MVSGDHDDLSVSVDLNTRLVHYDISSALEQDHLSLQTSCMSQVINLTKLPTFTHVIRFSFDPNVVVCLHRDCMERWWECMKREFRHTHT
jgi:hypothetical protein